MCRPRAPLRPIGVRLRVWMGGWWLLLLFLQAACATGAPQQGRWVEEPSFQNSNHAREVVSLRLSAHFEPVQLSARDFHAALTRLMLEAPLPLVSRSEKSPGGKVVFAAWQPGTDETSIERGYARLCENRGTPGDCFLLMGGGSRATPLDEKGKFSLGLILALSPAVDAAAGVLKDFSANAMTILLSGLSVYLLMLLAPEPSQKGLPSR